jgi:hypothetical protein
VSESGLYVTYALNDRREIVGYLGNETGTHGFLAAVPAPSSLLLLGTSRAFGAAWTRVPRRRADVSKRGEEGNWCAGRHAGIPST